MVNKKCCMGQSRQILLDADKAYDDIMDQACRGYNHPPPTFLPVNADEYRALLSMRWKILEGIEKIKENEF